ncbi:hypothetical protein PHYC_03881 [Phycisphaerales bacterium]|nr:hypothetical protein PHYC_03881 [Phycisphaerales bacterium]
MSPRTRGRPLWALLAFWLYAPVLFLGTHWPKLQVEGPIPRTDLVVHFSAFGLWSSLCAACGWFGQAGSARNLWRTWVLGLLYAAFDEGLQLVPALGRVAAWDDYTANAVGITLGVLLVAGVARARLGGSRDAKTRP